MSYYTMHYGLSESKLFIILTKYISLERSESQDSIFYDRSNIDRNLDICDRKIQWSLAAPGGCLWYDALNKISQQPQFFSYQLQIWNITYSDIRLSFYSNFRVKPVM